MRYTPVTRRFITCFSLLFILLLSGCNPAPQTPLRIGSNIWPGYQPLYLAQSLGYYQNSPIKLIRLTSTLEVLHALRNGNLEGAALTLDEALTLVQDDYDLSIILVMDFSNGGDALLAKPDIQSLQQLKGKQVALGYTTVSAVLLERALNSAGLTPKDIDIVNCTLDTHVDCYASVDAIVTFEPEKTKLENIGAKMLYNSSRIPKKIVDVLVVRNDLLSEHEESLKLLLSGHFKALDYLANNSQAATRMMADEMGITPTETTLALNGLHLPSLQENRQLLSSQSSESPSPIERAAKDLSIFMLDKGFLKKQINVQKLVNARFLPGDQP